MNKRLAEEIMDMIQKMDADESSAFVKYSKRKDPGAGKEHKYIMLYQLYSEQADTLDFDEELIRKKAGDISSDVNELHKKLNEELLRFIGIYYREGHSDSIERKINEHLDTGIALFEKGLYNLSANSLIAARDSLYEVYKKPIGQDILYLSLKTFAWLFKHQIVSSMDEEEQIRSERLDEQIGPFNHIARAASQALHSMKVELIGNQDFERANFYSLLNLYMKERASFRYFLRRRVNITPFGSAIKSRDPQHGGKKEVANDIIEAESFLFLIERMHAAILANDPNDFNDAFESISHKLFNINNSSRFNGELTLFIFRKIFELKTVFTLKNNVTPVDINGIRELEKISRERIQLFRENEVDNFPVRIELNAFIVYFLEKRFDKLQDLISKYEKAVKKNIALDYYLDIKLMGIICSIEIRSSNLQVRDKKIGYYENFIKIKTNNSPEFHRKFSGFLNAFLSIDRKDTCIKYLPKLEASMETFNHFHYIFLDWVKARVTDHTKH